MPELGNKNEIMVAVAPATEWRLICNCNCLSNLIKGYLGSAAGPPPPVESNWMHLALKLNKNVSTGVCAQISWDLIHILLLQIFKLFFL